MQFEITRVVLCYQIRREKVLATDLVLSALLKF